GARLPAGSRGLRRRRPLVGLPARQDQGAGGAGRLRRGLTHRLRPGRPHPATRPRPAGPRPGDATDFRGGDMGNLVYFSSASQTTHRFVERLGLEAHRIPLRPTEPFLTVDEEYVLIVPTYGGGNQRGAVPRQVIKFLND